MLTNRISVRADADEAATCQRNASADNVDRDVKDISRKIEEVSSIARFATEALYPFRVSRSSAAEMTGQDRTGAVVVEC